MTICDGMFLWKICAKPSRKFRRKFIQKQLLFELRNLRSGHNIFNQSSFNAKQR